MPARAMTVDDVDLAVELINREGWGHTRIDLERILSLSPESNYVWESNGVARGFLTSVVYERTATVAHVLVSKESRGRQIGKNLVKTLLEKLDADGIRSAILYATEDGARLYRKYGFETVGEMLSVGLYVRGSEMRGLECECLSVEDGDISEVVEIDRATFGDGRGELIARLCREFPEHCYKLERDGDLAGFALGRRTPIGFDIGPWICTTGSDRDAGALLASVISSFPAGGRVDLYPFRDHPGAKKVLSRYRHYKTAETVGLMVRGEPLYASCRESVFSVAGFELG
ncbi:TPA: GNAT family N-acetyltransferase [Thermoplasmata archaeon]|nr:GNAT family N-acetyltransferase [Thermoplasmata archaeon]